MKIIIQGSNGEQENLVPYIEPESFILEEEVNVKNQVTFTLFQTEQVASLLADIETKLSIDGQTYVIKQVDNVYNQDQKTKNITATHLFFECQSFRTSKAPVTNKKVSINELLDYYFKGNEGGFTYRLHGNFPKIEIDTMNSGSVRDGITLALDKYPSTYIQMDNRIIHIFTESEWLKKEQHVIHYYHDTQNVTLGLNSLNLSNIVRCNGGKDDKGKNYFTPFYVQDDKSIAMFGKKYLEEIHDDRFRDPSAMKAYALKKLQPEPVLTLQMVFNSSQRPTLGKQYPFVLHSMNYHTEVTIMSYRWFPLAPLKLSEVTFNNVTKNFLQYHNDVELEIKKVQKNQKIVDARIVDAVSIANDAKRTADGVDQKATDAKQEAEKALAGQIFGKVVKDIENH